MSRLENELKQLVYSNLADFSSDVIDWVKENFAPQDIFSKSDLENWAEDNGYVKSDKS